MPSPGWAAGPRVGPCLLSPLSIPAPVSTIRLPGPNSSSLVPIPTPWFWSSLFGSHPGSWVPIPDPWSPPAAGASLDAAEPGALSGSSSGQRRARAAETRDTYLPGRLSATRSSLAGVRPRSPRGRWSSLELGTWRAGTPSPSLSCALSPAPGTPRHHPQPQASAPLSHVARSRQTTPCHPRSPPLLSLWHFTGYSAARRPPTPSAHVLQRSLPAPTSPDGPRPPGNLWTQAGRCRVPPSTSPTLAPRSSRWWCHCDVMCAVCCISCVKMYFVLLAVVEPRIVTFNIIEMCLFPGINHWLVTGLDPSAQLLPLAENLPKSLASFQTNQPTLFPFLCMHVCT